MLFKKEFKREVGNIVNKLKYSIADTDKRSFSVSKLNN